MTLSRGRNPRLVMTADVVGGIWTYALELAKGLAGFDTTLVVFGPAPSAAQRAAAEAVPGLELADGGPTLDWTAGQPAEVLEAARTLRDLARLRGADLIHLNAPAMAAVGGFSAPVVGACHSCLATWWSAVKEGRMPTDFRWRTHLLWRGLQACDALIAPSHAFAEATSRAYDLAPPQAVWNGRRPLARHGTGDIVFTSGRLWDEGKNAAILDRAAARLSVPIHAAGPTEGPNGSLVELQHLRRLGTLPPSEMAKWLRRACVYTSAARYEPFGLGVLEAAQAGCALVLSDIPTFRELWNGAAVFVAPEDAEGFAVAIERLLAEPVERDRLAELARARAATYSVEAMCAGVGEVYRRLAAPLFLPAREAAA
jgi:glycogen(starch) synthase